MTQEPKITAALIYDFDGTLAPGNMQEYDFIPAVGQSNREFWNDANSLAEEQDADMTLTYMAKMLEAARSRKLSLRREAFQESGRNIRLFPGVKEWFGRINAYAAARGVRVLHYINSSGLKEMIEGTPIAPEFRKIYACSFLYDVDGIAYWPGVAVNYTNKTQFIFKINKGVESVSDCKLVNQYIEERERPVPFSRMIYVGDEEHLFEGVVEGRIVERESGAEGFGYDPLFVPDGCDRTFAEMSPDEKNAVSHRGRAVRKLVAFLRARGEK